MTRIQILDIPILVYCIKPRPSFQLRARFKMERLNRLADAELIYTVNYGIDIYHPSHVGDAIIQISSAGVDYLWKLPVRVLIILAPIVSAIAAVLALTK